MCQCVQGKVQVVAVCLEPETQVKLPVARGPVPPDPQSKPGSVLEWAMGESLSPSIKFPVTGTRGVNRAMGNWRAFSRSLPPPPSNSTSQINTSFKKKKKVFIPLLVDPANEEPGRRRCREAQLPVPADESLNPLPEPQAHVSPPPPTTTAT